MDYPVRVSIEPPAVRSRLTTLFRIILALPHTILVGPVVMVYRSGSLGLLGAAAYFQAIVNWAGLMFTGRPVPGVRDFLLFYLRWRVRAVAYTALLVDTYPPFGDGPYPATLAIDEPTGPRDRLRIGLRLLLALPQLVALVFVLFAWSLTGIVAWFAILFTGGYPASLYRFGIGAMGWLTRVEAYLLLLVDEYPPFALEPR